MGEPVALPLADNAQAVVAGQGPLEDAQDGAVEGGVDDLTSPDRRPAAAVAAVEGGHGGEGGEHTGQVVRHRDAGPDRRTVGITGEVQQAAEGDAQAVEPGARGVRARLAEDADADVDQGRVQVLGSQAPFLHGAGPEVLDHHVGPGRQPLEQILALGVPKIAGDAAPPPAFHRPRQRVVGAVVHRR